MYFKPGAGQHVASLPVVPGSGGAKGSGLAWIETGESEETFKELLGDVASPRNFQFEIRYNGGTAGLYAMGINMRKGLKEIRRNAVKHQACPRVPCRRRTRRGSSAEWDRSAAWCRCQGRGRVSLVSGQMLMGEGNGHRALANRRCDTAGGNVDTCKGYPSS
ncbi:hypothetical protein [Polaromonas jejuensis]|uniref:Uncharacterized protein n=1 Tax=Polaromonas jejuensis TaxID=457502 RepID=A0ABW0Q8F6_9BURK|nr:hypothetical protein [Polaromonas jejuensis]